MCVVVRRWRSLGEVAATIGQTLSCSDFVGKRTPSLPHLTVSCFVTEYRKLRKQVYAKIEGLTSRYYNTP